MQNKYKILAVISGLIISALVVFWQVQEFGFVTYDDDKYVSENEHVLSGLTAKNVVWAFTGIHSSNWHPLTSLSHMLDCKLFGPNPGRHHLVNLSLHTVSTLLIFLILLQMTGAFWQSAFVAAVFGLHPLHVESVAWISERKDVLSALFWFLTMAAYFRYVKTPRAGRYLLTLIIFAMGLMAKPMLVTLPFVLLLLDYWPLERPGRKNVQQMLWEKIPFFIFSVVSCTITLVVQSKSGALKGIEQFSLPSRISNAAISYITYIVKIVWPADLSVFYPHPRGEPAHWQIYGSIVLLVCITAGVLRLSTGRKFLLVGWFWYLGTLVPVIGLVQVGGQAMADRYTYIPSIGFFIAVAWAANDLLMKWKYKKPVLCFLSSAVVLVFAMLTYFQAGHWRDSMSLFDHAVKVTSGNYTAYDGRGLVYKNKGLYDLAMSDFNKAIEINPGYAVSYNNRGNIYIAKGEYGLAISDFNKAIEIHPGKALVYNNRGLAYDAISQYDLALSNFNKALEINPGLAAVYYNRADVYKKKGDLDLALSDYTKSLEIKPASAAVHNDRGNIYRIKGRLDLAISDFDKAIEINPKLVESYFNKAVALETAGRKKEAIEAYKAFIQYASSQYTPYIEQAKQKIRQLEQ